jgi:peptide/nickel transport system substrate-binding protein
MSANGWGEPDARAQAVRELNRSADFRKAVTSALDRQRIGEALIKGPFTAIYAGGLLPGTPYYDPASTAYYPPSVNAAKQYLARAGLEDRDGDGLVNWPAGTLDGGNVEIVYLAPMDSATDRTIAEVVAQQLAAAGLRVVLDSRPVTQRMAMQQAGQYDWFQSTADTELIAVVQGTAQLAPIGPRVHRQHQVGPDGTLDLLPFEAELAAIVQRFIGTADPVERVALMKQYQLVYTENVYGVGLTQFAPPLLLSKRLANVPAAVPNLMFNYYEDAVMRERFYVPVDRRSNFELYPESLPGAPGSTGPAF